MKGAEFDKFAEEYQALHQDNIKLSGEGVDFFYEYKIKDLAYEARTAKLTGCLNILDFGAGVGNTIPYFCDYFTSSKITCLDVSSKSLSIAEKRFPKSAEFVIFDGNIIPLGDEEFDIVFSACVFHHIPHDQHDRLLKELYRVLRPGGVLVIFEHNPLNPLTQYVVNTCEFDENAVLIGASKFMKSIERAGYSSVFKVYRVFFPRLFRKLRWIERYLKWLPLGAQYYVTAKK